MITKIKHVVIGRFQAAAMLVLLLATTTTTPVYAAAPPPQNPQDGSAGLQGRISSPPPTQAATIAVPSNGASFTTIPQAVSGLCKTGLLVEIFDNNIFVGSTLCQNGSYSIQISLFSGQNDLVARVYDDLYQAGPDSNKVSIRFVDGQFSAFNGRPAITSIYARRGANPNETLLWPIVVTGGAAPYALSVEWGDGSQIDLLSQPNPGDVDIKHIYKSSGVYKVVVKATDKNGAAAFMPLVGVGNGELSGSTSKTTNSGAGGQSLAATTPWWPALIAIPFAIAAFWLGRRHELYSLRRSLERYHA